MAQVLTVIARDECEIVDIGQCDGTERKDEGGVKRRWKLRRLLVLRQCTNEPAGWCSDLAHWQLNS